MIFPNNLEEHSKILESEGISIRDLFMIPNTPFKEKCIRKYAAPAVGLMPQKIRYLLTDYVKKRRNPSKKLSLRYPLDFAEGQKLSEKLKSKELNPWWNKKAVVCVCHDVDNFEGADFVKEMSAINIKYDLRTTFNFLTHDNYQIDRKILQGLVENGFEVGLHGYTHDQGFAFRSGRIIKTKLQTSLDQLKDYQVMGYRSPALSVSTELFSSLNSLGIKYDSSLQVASPFYYSVKLPYPIYLEQFKIWELPLMVQDDNYLRDANTDEKIIMTSIRRFIEETITLNGVFVINMHPHLMVRYKQFYENFLKTVKEYEKDVVFTTTKEVVLYAQSYTNNQ